MRDRSSLYGVSLNRRFSSKAAVCLLPQPGGFEGSPPGRRAALSYTGSFFAFLMHFLRFLAFALPGNFFLHFLIAAAR
jgi:hypothetical protein